MIIRDFNTGVEILAFQISITCACKMLITQQLTTQPTTVSFLLSSKQLTVTVNYSEEGHGHVIIL